MAQREPVPGVSVAESDTIARLQAELGEFARQRDWEKYHTPRNLAALIATEAGELLALFRWDEDAVRDRLDDVRRELADVFLGVLRFADVCGIDLASAGAEKIRLNSSKYPPDSISPQPARPSNRD
jgi:NTP pyrophosphatase (non-canonical NTP hydrolase)